MGDFIATLLVFFLVSILIISIGMLVALCVMVIKIVRGFLEDVKDGK